MPTIPVSKKGLFEALGREYTPKEFETLCFEFGIELDDDTTDVDGAENAQLKIEIPANRYDMLVEEGIAMNLNIFNGRAQFPDYKIVKPASGKLEKLVIGKSTSEVRPYAAGAILRNITFTQKSYDSFIALQDKLHQNLARQRTLVAIGTHDLDTIQGPFSYDALPPNDFEFIPLNQTKSMNGSQLMEFYANDRNLGKYLHIIKDSPVYPLIRDANGVVCSMPPIINGNHSKISINTKNVFIEMTGTDRTKLEIVNNIMVTMFSQYCEKPFEIEPIEIVSSHNGEGRITPDLTPRETTAEVDYINDCTGLSATPETICKLLKKMCLSAKPSSKDKNLIDVQIPVTRADVLARCDIMEDVAIAWGFNNLPRSSYTKSATIGAPLKINKLADIVRNESAMSGWSEVMPLILCSHDESFAWLNREDDGNTAVRLANPKTAEYQMVRISLLPGLLKTISSNKHLSLPQKIFEVSDVAFKDLSRERKSRNQRNFGAAIVGKTSGFEEVHGLLDRILQMLKVAFVIHQDGLEGKKLQYEVKEDPTKANGYWLEEIDEPTFFKSRGASINVRMDGKEQRIGELGILRPDVLEKFDIRYPVSTLEINLEAFL